MAFVACVTDKAGSVLGRRNAGRPLVVSYLPYGGQRGALGTGQMAFVGQWREGESGCYLLGNGYRAYVPVLGRFIQSDRDSPFNQGGNNAYAYCMADPINRTDPSGRAFSAVAIASLVSNLAVGAMHLGSIGGASAKVLRPAMRMAAWASIVGVGASIASLVISATSKDSKATPYLAWAGIGLSVLGAGLRLSVTVPAMRQAGARKVLGRILHLPGRGAPASAAAVVTKPLRADLRWEKQVYGLNKY